MKNKMMYPYIAITIGVISMSMSAIFVKLSSSDAGVTAFYRMLFTIIIMFPLFAWKYTSELKNLTKRDWLASTVAGIFLAFHFILWFESLRYTSVASSTVLVTLQPVFAFIGTYIFFKEAVQLKTVIAALIAMSGSIIISWGDFQLGGTALFGDILALIACALVTVYLLFGQDVRKRLSLVTYTMVLYTISTITLFFYVLLKGESFLPREQQDWLIFLLLAIIPNLLGHTLFNWSLKWISVNVISVVILFEPVGAAILAIFIFSEYLSAWQIIGGVIVMVGITLFAIDVKKVKNFFTKKA